MMAVMTWPSPSDGWNPITWTEWAMNEAAGRAAKAVWHDPHRAFAGMGETLWWICALDDILKRAGNEEYLRARRDNFVDGPIKGLRHARNRFAHDGRVLDYLAVHEVAGDGGLGQHTEWKWLPLPPAPEEGRHGEAEYRESLEGKPINPTLQFVCNFLRGISRQYVREGHPRDDPDQHD